MSELLSSLHFVITFVAKIIAAMQMTPTFLFLLLTIIAVLSVVVAVLLWRNLYNQRELRDKNDVIIREIRENAQLRDELRNVWVRMDRESNRSQKVSAITF